MKILLLMDPGIPVPPTFYGGIERIVYLLAKEYTAMGHQVTLLAGPGSYCDGETVTFGINDMHRSFWQKLKEFRFVWNYLSKNKHNFDAIHNFGRLAYLLPVLNYPVKKIMSYQRRVSKRGIIAVNKLPHQSIVFTGCSNYCVSTGNVAGKWVAIYNGVDISGYTFNDHVDADAPLMFLGRLDQIKGAHTAIQVAKNTGNKLIIGGNIPDTPDNYKYFKEQIEPLFDGEQVIYVGALNDEEKNNYLQQCKALLFPIEWDEPFGIVMIEAMACGTPVIAFSRGAVPEVVEPGVNGFIATDARDMEALVNRVHTIDRSACYQVTKTRFDAAVIAKQYLDLLT